MTSSARRPLVLIESPYAGDVERNLHYARRAMRHSLLRNEAPWGSHLLYTQPGVLDDSIPEERQWGIDCGFDWSRVADYHAFYVDLGWSRGMKLALDHCYFSRRPVRVRTMNPATSLEPPSDMLKELRDFIRTNTEATR